MLGHIVTHNALSMLNALSGCQSSHGGSREGGRGVLWMLEIGS